jgi:hypothetical protein
MMPAHCTVCDWSGGPMKVMDGGRCPKCHAPVHYDHKPLPSTPGLTLHDFLPRAAKALKAVGAVDGDDFLEKAVERVDLGWSLAPVQVAVMMKVVLRFEGQINDRAVINFAIFHAKGAD